MIVGMGRNENQKNEETWRRGLMIINGGWARLGKGITLVQIWDFG